MEEKRLTKKEMKEQRREERQLQESQQYTSGVKKKWIIIGAITILALGILGLVIYKANQPEPPKPGMEVKQLGREHVGDISGITYTSNPPTSGKHFPLWAKPGVYPKIFSDGYLIHDLEHGYIVMSYNCGPLAKAQSTFTYKKGDPLTTMAGDPNKEMAPFTTNTMPQDTISPPAAFQSTSCKALVNNLASFLGTWQRIVIIPRVNLDAPIVFTAWGRIEKFSKFDKEKMTAFIEAFHNAGPEQTVE